MPSDREVFDALTALVLERCASEQELARFRELLKAHPEFIAVYRRQVRMAVFISGLSAREQSKAESAKEKDGGEGCRKTQRRTAELWVRWKAAAAALVLLGASLLVGVRLSRFLSDDREPAPDVADGRSGMDIGGHRADACVAEALSCLSVPTLVLVETVSVDGARGARVEELPQVRASGYLSRIVLEEGSYVFRLDTGVTCCLCGPGELSFRDDANIQLVEGVLLVEVAPEAVGFAVHTPMLHVRDLGTRFGVSVTRKTGATDVIVTKGRVAFDDALGREVMALHSGSGVRVLKEDAFRMLMTSGPLPRSLDVWQSHVMAAKQANGETAMNERTTLTSLGIGVVLSAASLSLNAGDGAWSANGSGPLQYWDASNWLDGQIANGVGSAANFTNALSGVRVAVTNNLTLWRVFYNPVGTPTVELEGDNTVLELDGGTVPEISVHRGRLNTYIPFTGDKGFIKYGVAQLYPYCRSQMTGPISVRGGTLGVDFNRDADSTRSDVLNHLQPDGLTFSSLPSAVRFGPRNSRASDQLFSFQTVAGSSTADVPSAEDLAVSISAGQALESDDGAFAAGTYIQTLLPDKRIRLSAPAMLTGTFDVTVKAKDFTTEQHFNYVDQQIDGTLYWSNLTLSIDELLGASALAMQSPGGGVARLGVTGRYQSKIRVFGDVKLEMEDQKPIPLAPATNTAFHVDASVTNTMVLVPSGSDILVKQWNDKYNTPVPGNPGLIRFAVSDTRGAAKPKLVLNALNGLPVIDFGAAASGKGFVWTDAAMQIRTVFWVIGSQAGGGLLLGSKDANALSFDRGGNMVLGLGETGVYTEPHTQDDAIFGSTMPGQVWVNGESVDMRYSGLSGGYDLVTFRSSESSPCSASGFAMRNTISAYPNRSGGQILAEVIIYERVLTDEEARDTEAYLAKKWFNRDIPGYGAARLNEVEFERNVAFGNQSTVAQQGAEPLYIDMMTVQSNRTLTVSDGSEVIIERAAIDASATLDVGNSSVVLSVRQTPVTLPVTNALMHFDASDSETLVLANGSEVALWRDAQNGPHCAESVDGFRPTLVPHVLNGLPVVDFGPAGSKQFLIWDTNLVVRSFFYVMNLKAMNITPIGTHRSHFVRKSHFTRYSGTGKVWDPLTQSTVLSGECYINGKQVKPDAYGLATNQFVLLGQVMDGSSVACAFGCEAYDHNNPEDLAYRTGGQQLAEVVIYDRKLTRQESLDVQAYLNWKWFGTALAGYAAPGQAFSVGAVEVAAGKQGRLSVSGPAAVDLREVRGELSLATEGPVRAEVASGSALNVDGVAASGTVVQGDCVANSLDFNDDAIGQLTSGNLTLRDGARVTVNVMGAELDQVMVTGTLTVQGNGTIEMLFDARSDFSGQYEVMTFGTLEASSMDNLGSWQVAGNLPSQYKWKVVADADSVMVRVSKRGFIMMVK